MGKKNTTRKEEKKSLHDGTAIYDKVPSNINEGLLMSLICPNDDFSPSNHKKTKKTEIKTKKPI